MTYLLRNKICERLRLGYRQSFRIVGSSYGERISSDDVVELLNKSRRGTEEMLTFIPSDLMTPEETAEHFKESEITSRELRAWIHRTKNVPPHFRINKQTVRFSARLLNEWLASRSKVKRRF